MEKNINTDITSNCEKIKIGDKCLAIISSKNEYFATFIINKIENIMFKDIDDNLAKIENCENSEELK